jgi:gentisate 1,2-dioxygenase
MHEEICYCLSGDGVSVIGDAIENWTSGDAIFIPPLEWHEHRNQSSEIARVLVHTNRPLTENIGLPLTQHFSGETKV